MIIASADLPQNLSLLGNCKQTCQDSWDREVASVLLLILMSQYMFE